MGTILVGAVLVLLIGAITAKLIKDRKQGKSSCGCGCAHCANAGRCHKCASCARNKSSGKH